MTDTQELFFRFDTKTVDAICNAVAQRPWVEANPILQSIGAQLNAQKQKAPEGALPVIDDAPSASPAH